jgi:F0F1-type ATP synthase membrane subunit b/b'
MFNEKFWLAIAFFSFLGLLIKFVFPKIAKNLDAQSKKIAEDILEAKKLREGAQKLLEEAQVFHKHSIEHSQKIITDAIEEANLSKEANIRLRKQLRQCTETLTSLKTQLAYALTEDDHRIKQMLQKILNPPLH